MNKALLVSLDKKKEAQIAEDIALGPRGRFFKMFHLIALSIRFSQNKRLIKPLNAKAIVLKRKHDSTSKAS